RIQASADVPRTTKWSRSICTADFGRIWANLRQWWIILGGGGFGAENASNRDISGPYQLRLKPAPRLLLAAPDGVSPIEPEMVTPSNSFCSAPTLRSHLSS